MSVYISPHSASYTSAIGVFAPLAGRKTPPAQVAEGQRDRAAASIGASWSWMHQEHATLTSMGTYCKLPGPPDLDQQLALVVFSFQPMAQILQLHSCNLHYVVTVQWCLYVVHVLVYM